MEKLYTSSEIIFGTRKEYIELQKKLTLLKELTNISGDKEIKDISYYVDTRYPNLELCCIFEQNPKTLKGIIEFLEREVFHTFIYGRGISTVLKDNNNRYYIPDEQYSAFIYDENQKKYKEIVDEILNLDICNNVKFGYIRGREKFSSMNFRSNEIEVHVPIDDPKPNQNYLDLSICSLYYQSKDDTIYVFSLGDEINKPLIEKLLNIHIDSNLLSEYQKKLIDSYPAKKIYIDDSIVGKDRIDLNIEEKGQTITLRKKR